MSKKILAMLAALLIVEVANATIRLTFKVKNPTLREVVIVYQTTIHPISLDASGVGTTTIEDVDAVHAQAFYGQASRSFFMEEGDSLVFSFDGNDFKGTLALDGQKARIFRYLNTFTLTAPDVQEYKRPFDEYLPLVEAMETEAMDLFKNWHFEKISPRFAEVEAGRIHYGYASNLMMYVAAHPMLTKEEWTPTKQYTDLIRENSKEYPRLAGLREYREYMKEAARIFDPHSAKGESLLERSLKQMKWFAENINNDTLRETLINVVATEYVDQEGVKNAAPLRNLQATYVTMPSLNRLFDKACAAWDLTVPGRPSPEPKAETLSGDTLRLSDYRGKYIYIDLWATWCAPCRKQFPFLKTLEEKFKGKNIVFIGLSTDADKEAWRAMAPTLSGIQAHLGTKSEFARAYKVEGIPHFILLDRQGRIINNAMTRPSDPETEKYLENLEGI